MSNFITFETPRLSSGLRSYLSLFDNYQAIDSGVDNEGGYFGWLEEKEKSFAFAKPGELEQFGGSAAGENLVLKLKEWVDIGMPTLANMNLRIYPSNVTIEAVIKRSQSTFVWSLPES